MWGYCWLSCSLAISASWALGLAILAYVDDFATIAPASTTMAGILSLHEALGIPVHRTPGKIQDPDSAQPCTLLGVVITVKSQSIEAANDPDRVDKLVGLCRTTAARATIPLLHYHQLLGKLSWCSQLNSTQCGWPYTRLPNC